MEVTNLSFEEWVRFIFDRPVTSPAWYWDTDADWWQGEPCLSVEYMTRAFEDAAEVLRPYSDAQLNQGLWYLINETGGEMYALLAESVSLTDQLRCVRSIFTLFKRCFAVRCSDSLSHRDEKANPLNAVCYMWWDIFPTWGAPNDPARHMLDSELLRMMRKTLALDSEACRESALHGLGHWRLHYPDKTTEIIDDFLAGRTVISRPLRSYALRARKGMVL